MSEWQLWAADAVVMVGLAALTLTVSALLRMPDPLIQVHATAKGVVLGVLAVLAASVFAASAGVVLHALLVAAFVLPTSAVASHALVRLHQLESESAPVFDDHADVEAPGPPQDDVP